MNKKFTKSLIFFCLNSISLATMFFLCFWQLEKLINISHGATYNHKLDMSNYSIALLLAVAIQFFLGRFCGGGNKLKEIAEDFEISSKIALPSLLFLPSVLIFFVYTKQAFAASFLGKTVIYLYLSYITPALMSMTISVIGLRFFAVLTEKKPKVLALEYKDENKSQLLMILLTLSIIMIGYGVYLQRAYLNSLLLLYYDWGIFLNAADNTLQGNWFFSNEVQHNFLGRHMMPLSILILTPFVALFRNIDTMFFINSITLYGSAFAVFYLAKAYKLRVSSAFMIAVSYLLYPSITNLNLALYYGFHCIYFIIPICWLFFILLEKKHYKWALTVFFLSMLIKESVPILWFGTGFYMLCRKKYKWALLMLIFSPIYFIIVSKVLMPYFAQGHEGDQTYYFFSYYKILAPNQKYSEIILAPFNNPKNFFGLLFRRTSINFIFLLTMSFIPFIVRYPLPILGGIAWYGLLSVQDTSFRHNMDMQYQTEIIPFIFIALILGCRYFNHGSWGKIWGKICFFNLGLKNKLLRHTPILLSVIPALLCSLYFYGEFPYTPNKTEQFEFKRDHRQLIKEIKKHLPEKVSVTMSPQLASHFVLRNDCWLNYYKPKKYVVLSLDTNHPYVKQEKFNSLREIILKSHRYQLVTEPLWDGGVTVLIYKRLPKDQLLSAKQVSKLPNIDEKSFAKFGMKYPLQSNGKFEMRIRQKRKKGEITFLIALKVKKKLQNDYYFDIKLIDKKNMSKFHEDLIFFGHGKYLPWQAAVNDVFFFRVKAKVPQGIKDIIFAPVIGMQQGPSQTKVAKFLKELLRTK